MCGIFAYLGTRECIELLITALERLEYRGYDSAGVAVHTGEKVETRKVKGRVAGLKACARGVPGRCGIAHTRWATHGPPTEQNAHPHSGTDGLVHIVHNGIIENYHELKAELKTKGCVFKSETDSEVLAHLFEVELAQTPDEKRPQVINRALARVRGTYGVVVCFRDTPGMLIGVRMGSPLIVGSSPAKDEIMLASDASAIIEHTKDVYYLEDREMVVIQHGNYEVMKMGTGDLSIPVTPEMERLNWSLEEIQKGAYEHFMLKEIFDQPNSIKNCLRGRVYYVDAQETAPGVIPRRKKQGAIIRDSVVVDASTHIGDGQDLLLDQGEVEPQSPVFQRRTERALSAVSVPPSEGAWGIKLNGLNQPVGKAGKFAPPKRSASGLEAGLASLASSTQSLQADPVKAHNADVKRHNEELIAQLAEGKLTKEEAIAQLRSDLEEPACDLEQRSALQALAYARRVIICACGTSWHAGLIGEYLIEQLAHVPVEVEYASEFRYREPLLFPNDDVVIVMSQSGETHDTLEVVRIAKEAGVPVIGVVNVVGSTIARETDAGVYLHAGPEIGVASTKAFTAQVTVLAMLALRMASSNGQLKADEAGELIRELHDIPKKVAEIVEQSDRIKEISRYLRLAQNALFLGRGAQFPVALEGALKLKEISYIHAEGYPAAEMKHGPIALIDRFMPVFVIAPKSDPFFGKVLNNMEEVKTRGASIICITDTVEGREQDDKRINELSDSVIRVPATNNILSPLLTVVPLQLLSYHIANFRGCAIDKPRNLAKSVTVE